MGSWQWVHCRVCLCSSSTPPRHRESWKLLGLHERENPLHDGCHSCFRSCIPGNLSNETHACSPASELPPAETHCEISASLQLFVPQNAKEAMTSRDGPSTLTGVLALLKVKHSLDGVLSLDLPMEEPCTEHPHTSHFLVFVRTHDNVSHDICSRCQCASYHPCVMRLCV